MLSARKQERDIVGALQLGANDFVVKPFIPEELVARLARLLGEVKG
jgi:two-component system OmpR family response regulator